MKRSMEKEIRELDPRSEYQAGYRDGWIDALRMIGMVPEEHMHRVERIITDITERVNKSVSDNEQGS